MKMEDPKWLIQDIWTANSHGILGGEPKSSKTTTALALALSVASGQPFLGRYSVGTPGPVLFIQEENAPWAIQDKLRKLAVSYGLISRKEVELRVAGEGDLAHGSQVVVGLEFPTDAPFEILNNYGFDLSLEEHRDALWQKVEEVKPALLVLDPLYLILSADENHAPELRPFLKWLIALKAEFGCAIMVIHHMRKKNLNSSTVVRPGQNLMGSAILHAWVDSALYSEAQRMDKEGWTSCVLEREFRSMAPQSPLEIDWNMGQPGDLEFKTKIRSFSLGGKIEKLVERDPGIPVRDLAEKLGIDRAVLNAVVNGGGANVKLKQGGRGPGNLSRLFPGD
jgi:RecA-family ATPase